MSIIIPANSAVGGGFDVANSLRFNTASSDSLTRTQSASPTSATKGTLSFWIKRSLLGTAQYYMSTFQDSNNRVQSWFQADDTFKILQKVSASTTIEIITNRVFRDLSAWYHVVLAFDTDQGTSSNRVKIYINGVQQTSFSTATYPAQGQDSFLTKGTSASLGAYNGTGDYTSAYFSEIVLIDGQQLTPTSFGEFDEDSGVWKPIDVSGLTFGTNGYYLDFEDSSALGNDAAGSNNFTANNLAAIDQSTDTCTNNFATMNSLIPGQTNYTYSDGNLTIAQSGSAWVKSNSTIGMSSGKWYWEAKYVSGLYTVVGVDKTDTATPYPSTSTSAVGWKRNGNVEVATQPQTDIASYAHGDTVSIALDMDNGCVYFGKSGVWQNSGNPESGSSKTGAYSLPSFVASTPYFATLSPYGSGATSVNFGNAPYSITSGNSDENDIGNFEYTVPDGYFALCSKNLAEHG